MRNLSFEDMAITLRSMFIFFFLAPRKLLIYFVLIGSSRDHRR